MGLPSGEERLPWMLHALGLFIGAALLLPALGSVPGLNGDEAWAGLRAHALAQGDRPLTGMNPYTGPFHAWLALPFLALGGWSVASLRLPGALANLFAAHLYGRIGGRLFDPLSGALATLALVSFPFFVGQGRLAVELTALSPFLATSAAWLLLAGRPLYAFGAGLLLAVGCWNHLLFLAVPVAYLAVAAAQERAALLRSLPAATTLAGFLLGLGPRFLLSPPSSTLRSEFSAQDLLSRLEEWPLLFPRLLHGDLLYLRFCGEVASPTLPLAALLILVGLGYCAYKAVRGGPGHRTMAVAFLVLFLVSLVLSPGDSDRYFLMPLWATPLVAAPLMRLLAVRIPRLSVPGMALLLILQVTRSGLDYFRAFERSGGREVEYALGSTAETSNHFVDTEYLYRRLVEEAPAHVVTEFHIGMPLKFYDLPSNRLKIVLAEDLPAMTIPVTGSDRLICYREGLRRVTPALGPGFQVFVDDGRFLELAPP